jgi:Tfp pilus assembly protein PilF
MRKERIAKLHALLERDPNDSFSRYALALEYAGLSDTNRAIQLLLEVLERNPLYVPAFQQLGYLYQRIGEREKAVDMFRRGIGVAAQQGDHHARSEMQEALDELEE